MNKNIYKNVTGVGCAISSGLGLFLPSLLAASNSFVSSAVFDSLGLTTASVETVRSVRTAGSGSIQFIS